MAVSTRRYGGCEAHARTFMAAAIRDRIEALDSVHWVRIYGPLRRIVAAVDGPVSAVDDIIELISAIEDTYGVGEERFRSPVPSTPVITSRCDGRSSHSRRMEWLWA